MSSKRFVTVQERGDRFNVRHNGPQHSEPMIRLRGKWLRQLGFIPGHRIAVNVEYGRLILSVAETDEDNAAGRQA
jgi:hypothetical protein